MSPHALRQRMRHGNVYPPERTQVALDRFFTEPNLTALREIALRFVAQTVDDAARRDRPGRHERSVHRVRADRRGGRRVERHSGRAPASCDARQRAPCAAPGDRRRDPRQRASGLRPGTRPAREPRLCRGSRRRGHPDRSPPGGRRPRRDPPSASGHAPAPGPSRTAGGRRVPSAVTGGSRPARTAGHRGPPRRRRRDPAAADRRASPRPVSRRAASRARPGRSPWSGPSADSDRGCPRTGDRSPRRGPSR